MPEPEDFARTYAEMSDDELLNTATETQQLLPEAAQALGTELKRRKLTAVDVSSFADYLKHYVPPNVVEQRKHSSSFAYISVPFYALKELWFSKRSQHWISEEATIKSCSCTVGGYKETQRVQVRYEYEIDGKTFAGHLTRDSVFGGVDIVVGKYGQGDRAMVRVNPEKPEESYLASDMGYLEPFFVGIVSFGTILILSLIAFAFVIGPIIEYFIERIRP